MIVPEPRVNREKLSELLEEGHESARLDYKAVLDLSERNHTVKLAKHVGAMQAECGYIVVGVDQNGVPTGQLTRDMARKFDQASLQAILSKWIPDPSAVRTCTHHLDTGPVVVIYVETPSAGVCIFAEDGVLDGSRLLFRKGETFVRHGTASERWNQADFQRLVERQVDAAKDLWRSELGEDMRRMGVATGAQALARGPAAGLTWQLDADTFDATVVELLRAADDIPLRQFLDWAVRDARTLLLSEGAAESDVPVILDRLTCLVAIGLRLERLTWVDRGIRSLLDIYRIGFDGEGLSQATLRISVPLLWRWIIERVEALGALAIRRQRWDEVALLARQRVDVREFRRYGSWLRHGLTMASRNNHLGDAAEPESRSLIQLAHNLIRENPCLRPDLTDLDEDPALNSLCQFDALAAVVSLGSAMGGWSEPYPSFARFYSHRTVPILRRLLVDPELRKAVFPGSDDELAAALRTVDDRASKEAWAYSGWMGFSDDDIERFVAENTPPEP